jgi:hypothetical protein
MANYVAADGVSNEVIKMDRHLGDAMVRQGILKPAPVVKPPKSTPRTAWGIATFNDGRPYIVANCATCKPKSMNGAQFRFSGGDPEANLLIWHCGVGQRPPIEIVQEYLQLRSRWVAPKVSKEPRPERARVQEHANNF